jgi:hypothetical protein
MPESDRRVVGSKGFKEIARERSSRETQEAGGHKKRAGMQVTVFARMASKDQAQQQSLLHAVN